MLEVRALYRQGKAGEWWKLVKAAPSEGVNKE